MTVLDSARAGGGHVDRSSLTIAALQDAGMADLLASDRFAHIDEADVEAVVKEYVRFCDEVIAPTDRDGDRLGCAFDPVDQTVRTPPGMREAYRQFVDAQWACVSNESEIGGGGFPNLVGIALQEILASANLGFSVCPALTQSAVELLTQWGSQDQQQLFLPSLITGEWNGTMLITEPDAGSDVGRIRTSAVPSDDGRWEISGTKVFISFGEHDLTDNIVHFVLARTIGSPPGTKGLSLFVVPKYETTPNGLGKRNRVRCTALEHKMGLHSSPTCVMELDGAVGEIVGEEHQGMRAMFSMMNPARLAIGLQGLAVGETAREEARIHAAERVQGRRGMGAVTIDALPDVRRMLTSMRASLDAMRLLIYETAVQTDVEVSAADSAVAQRARRRGDLLTPIAKAWVTDLGVEVASLAIQVQGGMGFMEESRAPQRLRDARIGPIYEGTNGIQAVDLVMRKIVMDSGSAIEELLSEMEADSLAAARIPAASVAADKLTEAVTATREVTAWLQARREVDLDDVLAGATAYLRMLGDAIGGWLLLRRALQRRVRAAEASDPESAGAAESALSMAHFFAVEHLALVPARAVAISAGASRLTVT